MVIEQDKTDSSLVDIVGVVQKIIAMHFSVVMNHGRSALEWKAILPANHQESGIVLAIVYLLIGCKSLF